MCVLPFDDTCILLLPHDEIECIECFSAALICVLIPADTYL